MVSGRLHRAESEIRTGLPVNEASRPTSARAVDDPTELTSEPAEPRRLRAFLSKMTELSRAVNRAIALRLPWWDYKTFVDVGTAQGDLAVQVALANPHLRGTGIDLPAIEPIFRDHAAAEAVSDRVTFLGSDLRADPLPKAEVVLMGPGLLLHDCDVEIRRALVKKSYEALPRDGTLVVYESSDAADHTGDACQRWMRETGFPHSRVEPIGGSESIVIARK
jgi:hypothetical protein